jgi:CoA:oxalate CoA-transferase
MKDMLLSGLTVLDLGHYISGPYCTKLLAGMGAEVIKIEKPDEGDPSRRMGPFPDDAPHLEKSGTFLYLNTGKKSITLNLKTDTGKTIFKRLLKDADVVVENFKPGVMSNLGISYDDLKNISPGLIMTSISNFGQNGPYRDYRADEMVILAMGGFMYLGGYPEREPLRLGFSASQYKGGLAGFTGTMAAFYYAQKHGIGQHVDISLMECIVASHFQAIEQYSYTGTIQKRNRTMLAFPVKDGIVQFNMQPHHWPKMTQMIGMPELTQNPKFNTTEQRRIHAEELETILLSWMLDHTTKEVYELGQSIGLPVGFAATTADLFEAEQYKDRGFLVEIDHPLVGKLIYPGSPFKIDGLGWNNNRAPLLGEHNNEIYCQKLGYSKNDLVVLRQNGII